MNGFRCTIADAKVNKGSALEKDIMDLLAKIIAKERELTKYAVKLWLADTTPFGASEELFEEGEQAGERVEEGDVEWEVVRQNLMSAAYYDE
jgi:hypothetical protein